MRSTEIRKRLASASNVRIRILQAVAVTGLRTATSVFGIYLILIFFSGGCGNSEESQKDSKPQETAIDSGLIPEFPYRLKKPDWKLKLPGYMQEISGLTYAGENLLGCIGDELGLIDFIDVSTGKIVRQVEIGEHGDFEGIEVAGNRIWALRSDGKIFRICGYESDNPDVSSFATEMDPDCNAEGLGFDAGSGNLLITCKGDPGKGKNRKGKKAIFLFDTLTKRISAEPFLLIDPDKFQTFRNNAISGGRLDFFDEEAVNEFNPSAIAVHPVTTEIYILSANERRLVVVSKGGEILAVKKLDPDHFIQPEGIAFDNAGNLFIASEGGGKEGEIRRFDWARPAGK